MIQEYPIISAVIIGAIFLSAYLILRHKNK